MPRLSNQQKYDIAEEYRRIKTIGTVKELAERFGVSQQTVVTIGSNDAFIPKQKNARGSSIAHGRDQTQENAGVSPKQDTSGETTTNGGTQ